MKNSIKCTHVSEMNFEAEVNGFKISLDADPSTGGQNKGPRPKPLILVALAGCTAMDVISILNKMKYPPEYFNVNVEADLTEEHPKTYNNIKIIYEFKYQEPDEEKVKKAIELSLNKYCGVNALLSKATNTSYEIIFL